MSHQSDSESIREIRRFNRDFTVRLGLLNRYRFDSSLTLAEARVLLEIGNASPASHSQILHMLHIDPGYLSRILAKLGGAGLLTHTINPLDRRSKHFRLTKAGTIQLSKIHQDSDRQVEEMISHLDGARRDELTSFLAGFERLIGRIEADGLQIKPVSAMGCMPMVAEVMREYALSLGVDLGFQDFEAEMANLPGAYAPPCGCILLAFEGAQAIGCVALRPMDESGCCEMKRLFVRPAWRSLKLGARLAKALIAEAQRLGYRTMRLHTLAKLEAACRLYRNLGFREIPAYYDNPLADVVYFEKDLTGPVRAPGPAPG